MHKANWDDLRYVLAVVDHGSVGAAGRALGVNHATVLRRIAAFEEATGGPVFERHAQGYRLRPDRAAMIEAAREGALAIRRAVSMMRPTSGEGGRVLRLTSVDSLCTTVLAREQARIARRVAPHRVELVSSNLHLDLARLQADVCLRPAQRLPDGMEGRQIGTLSFGVYEMPGAGRHWLGFAGALLGSPVAEAMNDLCPPDQTIATADSFLVLRAMAEAGSGRALMPCIVGDASPVLRRIAPETALPDVPLWVGYHRDLAGSRMIETLTEAVAGAVRAQAPALAGGPWSGSVSL